MNPKLFNLLLADDDEDDCNFFKEALEDLSFNTKLTTVNDGVNLMNFLTSNPVSLPDILFLDLNMPRKNGYECLSEIKYNEKLSQLPVIIFSTSFDKEVVNSIYQKGAHYYIQKPGEYSKLKKVIFDVLSQIAKNNFTQPDRMEFVLKT